MIKTEAYQNSSLFLALSKKAGFKAGVLYAYKGDGFVWDRNSTAYRTNQSGVLESMAVDVPRVDYSNTCPELLIEDEATNVCLSCKEYDNAIYWVQDNGGTGSLTITPNYAEAPNGTMTAYRMQFSKGSDYIRLQQFFTVVNASKHTQSIWVKSLSGTPTLAMFFDGATSHLITATGDWVRYKKPFTASGTDVRFLMGLFTSNPATSASADLLFWVSQMEEGEKATSEIITTTTAVTRAQDIAYSDSVDYTGLTGTIFVRARISESTYTKVDTLLSLNDGTTDNYILIYTNENRDIVVSTFANPDQNDYTFSVLGADGICNIAVGYDFSGSNNLINISIDGVQSQSIITQANNPPSALSRLDLGSLFGQLPQIDDKIIGVIWFDTQLDDTSLANLTS